MDYRKKNIGELESKKRESRCSLDLILEDFGGQLLNRIGGEDFPSGEVQDYRRLLQEVSDSESLIETIEADTLRLRELEENIGRAEQRRAAQAGELSGLYGALGKCALEDVQAGDAVAAYRQRADFLADKIETLESRLTELETREGANVFAWLGKNAQGVLARSSLAKARNNLERLYQEAGEQFTRPGAGNPPPRGESAELAEKIKKARSLSQNLTEELAGLREERRKLGGVFGAEGGPARQIQGLERHINHIRQELKTLYRRFGEQAEEGQHKKQFASLFYEDDTQVLDKIKLVRKTIGDYDGEIKKLKASLEIDAEKAEIEKMKKAVEEQRARIAAAEKNIGELEGRIQETQQRIGELEKLL
ncbi:MAG: hypothetical protein LBE14_07320 [Treponema sp.]|jgi:chromosome segregation ATPase|nr:hypothetical protein [Treponema sp.]